jgi:hypothetical protein
MPERPVRVHLVYVPVPPSAPVLVGVFPVHDPAVTIADVIRLRVHSSVSIDQFEARIAHPTGELLCVLGRVMAVCAARDITDEVTLCLVQKPPQQQ